jgi:hypothetical protein
MLVVGGGDSAAGQRRLRLEILFLQNQATDTPEARRIEEPSSATVTVHTGSERSGSP